MKVRGFILSLDFVSRGINFIPPLTPNPRNPSEWSHGDSWLHNCRYHLEFLICLFLFRCMSTGSPTPIQSFRVSHPSLQYPRPTLCVTCLQSSWPLHLWDSGSISTSILAMPHMALDTWPGNTGICYWWDGTVSWLIPCCTFSNSHDINLAHKRSRGAYVIMLLLWPTRPIGETGL